MSQTLITHVMKESLSIARFIERYRMNPARYPRDRRARDRLHVRAPIRRRSVAFQYLRAEIFTKSHRERRMQGNDLPDVRGRVQFG